MARRRFLDEQERPVAGALSEHDLVVTDDALQYGRDVSNAIRISRTASSGPATAASAARWEMFETFSRRLLEGVPFAELAERYGMTEGAVKMRFTRGLTELRRELARFGVER